MAEIIGTQKNGAEGVPHEDGRLVSERSGQFGVSDKRRAQLEKLEQDAGVQHEATDEGANAAARDNDPETATGLAPKPAAARPGDLQLGRPA